MIRINSMWWIHMVIAVVLVLLTNLPVIAQPGNLIANSSFETGGQNIGQEYNQNGWTFFIIKEPAAGTIAGGAQDGQACFEIHAEGGCGFLHSGLFTIIPSSHVSVSVWVRGKGDVSVEMLWWKKYDDNIAVESTNHRAVLKTVPASSGWTRITVQADVPADARQAYLRLVTKDGTVAFDNVVVNSQ